MSVYHYQSVRRQTTDDGPCGFHVASVDLCVPVWHLLPPLPQVSDEAGTVAGLLSHVPYDVDVQSHVHAVLKGAATAPAAVGAGASSGAGGGSGRGGASDDDDG